MATQTIPIEKTRFTVGFSISLLAGFVSLMATGCSDSAISKERASQPSNPTANQQTAISQPAVISQTTLEDSAPIDLAPIADWSAQQDRPEPNRIEQSELGTVPARFDVTPEMTADDVLMRAEGRDITYAQQPFEGAIFNQLRAAGFCAGVGYCSNVSYLFSDVVLSAQTFEQVSADITVIPHQPVSKEVALAYASILDTGASIDFVTAQIDQDISAETYFERGLPSSTSAMTMGSTQMVQLRMTPSGMVSEISFSFIVF